MILGFAVRSECPGGRVNSRLFLLDAHRDAKWCGNRVVFSADVINAYDFLVRLWILPCREVKANSASILFGGVVVALPGHFRAGGLLLVVTEPPISNVLSV